MIGIALTLFIWSAVVEPRYLVVRERTLTLENWRPELAGIRVALIGDLHVGAPPMGRGRVRHIVERTRRLRPELVLFLGDLVDTKGLFRSRIPLNEVAVDLRGLDAPLGVFGVLGNHDHWFGADRVRSTLERGGVRVIDNEPVRLRYRGVPFWLLGVGDDFTGHADLDAVQVEGPRILATHSPDLFPDVDEGVALTVAAHTHGGQVRLPGIGPLFVPSRFGKRYAQGHYRAGSRQLWVTSGLGTSMVPVRFGVPPEIVILTLQ
ncbi:MAG: metallophosphoesterase [Myxococcota bacterium]